MYAHVLHMCMCVCACVRSSVCVSCAFIYARMCEMSSSWFSFDQPTCCTREPFGIREGRCRHAVEREGPLGGGEGRIIEGGAENEGGEGGTGKVGESPPPFSPCGGDMGWPLLCDQSLQPKRPAAS